MQEAPPVDATLAKENALRILNAVYMSGRMDYHSDYLALREAISLIPTPKQKDKSPYELIRYIHNERSITPCETYS